MDGWIDGMWIIAEWQNFTLNRKPPRNPPWTRTVERACTRDRDEGFHSSFFITGHVNSGESLHCSSQLPFTCKLVTRTSGCLKLESLARWSLEVFFS